MKKITSKHLIVKLGTLFSTCLFGCPPIQAALSDPLEDIFWPVDGEIPQNLQSGRYSGKQEHRSYYESEPYNPPGTPIISLKTLDKQSPSSVISSSHFQAPPVIYDYNEIAQAEPAIPPQTPETRPQSVIFDPPQTPEAKPQPPLLEETESPQRAPQSDTITINFNNVSIIELIRSISRISNKNFIFDENDLQFNVTIVSEEPTSIDNILTALIQELRIHDLHLIEQGNNLIIHKNKGVQSISKVISGEPQNPYTAENEVVTQVFRLNSSDAEKVAAIIKPLISQNSFLDVLKETNHIIVTDLTTNVAEISKLIKNLDAPKSGMVIGQYVVRNSSIENLIGMTEQIMKPIANDQSLIFVPHKAANSVFIVSSPYLVERTISILQHMDQNQKSNKIYDYRDFKYQVPTFESKPETNLPPAGVFFNSEPYKPDLSQEPPLEATPINPLFNPPPVAVPLLGTQNVNAPQGTETLPRPPKEYVSPWNLDSQGNWTLKVEFGPELPLDKNAPPQGEWAVDANGNWEFVPGSTGIPGGQGTAALDGQQPKGKWKFDPLGYWTFLLDEDESITIDRLTRPDPKNAPIPYRERRSNKFFIHKLRYRKGFEIENSLQRMADALITNGGRGNEELAATLSSVQWLETSNSLIFSGPVSALDKIEYLVEVIDQPLRQVFIEMLIMRTSVSDSLNYGVSWSDVNKGIWSAGETSFAPVLPGAGGTNPIIPIQNQNAGIINPNPLNILANGNATFSLGVIGSKIVDKILGTEYNTIAAFIQAIQTRENNNLLLNPKIITEDSVPAEIFVGINTSFQTQAISNVEGSITTSNYEFRDVGTRLRVTPFLANSDIITLEIAQERSEVINFPNTNSANAGPSTSLAKTTTRVHLPNGCFLVLSGLLEDTLTDRRAQVPCLGGIPIAGAAFKSSQYTNAKSNLMLFVRAEIMDTEEELNRLTKNQQGIYNFKKRTKQDDVIAVEEALQFLNLQKRPQDDVSPEFEMTDAFR